MENEKENFWLKWMVKIDIYNADWTIKEEGKFEHNIITNAWLAALTSLGGWLGGSAFTYLGVWTSNTAEAATQTALVAEIVDSWFARKAATVTQITTSTTNDTFQLVAIWTATAWKTIEEIGIFNAGTAWTMLWRKLTWTKTINTWESISATYKIIMSRAA